jgi:hypothetical protein
MTAMRGYALGFAAHASHRRHCAGNRHRGACAIDEEFWITAKTFGFISLAFVNYLARGCFL